MKGNIFMPITKLLQPYSIKASAYDSDGFIISKQHFWTHSISFGSIIRHPQLHRNLWIAEVHFLHAKCSFCYPSKSVTYKQTIRLVSNYKWDKWTVFTHYLLTVVFFIIRHPATYLTVDRNYFAILPDVKKIKIQKKNRQQICLTMHELWCICWKETNYVSTSKCSPAVLCI